jgi:hypothetical protein
VMGGHQALSKAKVFFSFMDEGDGLHDVINPTPIGVLGCHGRGFSSACMAQLHQVTKPHVGIAI